MRLTQTILDAATHCTSLLVIPNSFWMTGSTVAVCSTDEDWVFSGLINIGLDSTDTARPESKESSSKDKEM